MQKATYHKEARLSNHYTIQLLHQRLRNMVEEGLEILQESEGQVIFCEIATYRNE